MVPSKRWKRLALCVSVTFVVAFAAGIMALGPRPSAHAAQTITRSDVIERAKFWVDNGERLNITYQQGGGKPDADGTDYRPDCSGYVSMAWDTKRLKGREYSTVDLPEIAEPIRKDELQPGDIMLHGGPGTDGDNGHVIIFEKWTSPAMDEYTAFEQGGRGGGSMPHRVTNPYPNKSGRLALSPYRLKGITGDGTGAVEPVSLNGTRKDRPAGGGEDDPSPASGPGVGRRSPVDDMVTLAGDELSLQSRRGTSSTVGERIDGSRMPSWLESGDFDGDGRDDLYFYAAADRTINVMRNNGDRNFGTPKAIAGNVPPARWAGAGDFDGDGTRDDVAVASGSELITFRGDTGSMTELGRIDGVTPLTRAAVGDDDGDGSDDLYWHSSADQAIRVVRSGAKGLDDPAGVMRSGVEEPRSLLAGDFDGDDRRDDVALAGGGQLRMLIGSGNSLQDAKGAGFSGPGVADLAGAATVDHNGDGTDDVYWYANPQGSAATAAINVLDSTGDGFTPAESPSLGPDKAMPRLATAGNFTQAASP